MKRVCSAEIHACDYIILQSCDIVCFFVAGAMRQAQCVANKYKVKVE